MQQLGEIKKILFNRYEVRKSSAQKTEFIDWVKSYAQELGMPVQVEESGKLLRTRNIVFGDLKSAKTLITAHYDTCARMPFPNFMTPDCWPIIILTQFFVPFFFFLALGFVMGFLSAKVLPLLMPMWVGEIAAPLISAAVIFAVVGLMLFGPQNPHTANDNTSGVALVLRLLPEYIGRKDVAFILFDNEEIGLLGSSAFVKAHPALQKNGFITNLDCISDGDTLLYVYSKAARSCPQVKKLIEALEEAAPRYGKRAKAGQSPKVLYPSDQMAFLRGSAFAALKGKKVLYLDRIHTAKDTVFEEQNLLCLAEVIKKAV